MTYILTTAIGTLASEVMPAPTTARKITNFILVVFLLATSTMIFGMFSYFRFGLFFVVVALPGAPLHGRQPQGRRTTHHYDLVGHYEHEQRPHNT